MIIQDGDQEGMPLEGGSGERDEDDEEQTESGSETGRDREEVPFPHIFVVSPTS